MFGLVEKERKRYEERLIPAVIPIPGVKGNTGIGIKRLSSFVENVHADCRKALYAFAVADNGNIFSHKLHATFLLRFHNLSWCGFRLQ